MPEVNFFWDNLSDNILQERDETGEVTATYTTEPGLYGNLTSQNRGGVVSQYHFDPQGSTLALSDDNQQITDTYAYSAFGEVTERTGTTVNPFQYIGKKQYYRDQKTGSYKVRQRSLSDEYGRWLTFDPIIVIKALRPYIYALNRPLNVIDPSGREDVFGDEDPNIGLPLNVTNCTEAQEKVLRYALNIIMDMIKEKGNACFKGAKSGERDRICREQLAECIMNISTKISFKCRLGNLPGCQQKKAFSGGDCPISKDSAILDGCKPTCHIIGWEDVGGHWIPFPIWSDPTCNACPEYLLEGSELVVCYGSDAGLPIPETDLSKWILEWRNIQKLMQLLVHEMAHQCIGGHTVDMDRGIASCGRPDAAVIGQDFNVNCIYNPAPTPTPLKPGQYP